MGHSLICLYGRDTYAALFMADLLAVAALAFQLFCVMEALTLPITSDSQFSPLNHFSNEIELLSQMHYALVYPCYVFLGYDFYKNA